jgi:hypothetical protein
MYLGEREPRYLFRIKNNTSRAVEVVATRADTTLKSFIVQPKNQTVFDAQVSSEAALSEIAFRVNLDYVPPQPPDTTETEASEPAPNEDEPTDTASQPAEADN